ncbi:MAG TPA: zf-HC2 domain-containing protein [Tepidisphaeraceae bacterium]|jgi:anti-sigma factor RsiW|nr:zf-HC2 domain-containing protein [Tepidisphaeraceae bacterium]
MSCDLLEKIHAYHDGELPAAERGALEAHLKSCSDCSELLNELQSLSRVIAAAPMVQISNDALRRLRDRRYVLPDAGVLKIAGWLTAAAAAVLLAALLVFPKQQADNNVAAGADLLDTVAVAPPTEPTDSNRNDLVALAQQMADELSTNDRQ